MKFFGFFFFLNLWNYIAYSTILFISKYFVTLNIVTLKKILNDPTVSSMSSPNSSCPCFFLDIFIAIFYQSRAYLRFTHCECCISLVYLNDIFILFLSPMLLSFLILGQLSYRMFHILDLSDCFHMKKVNLFQYAHVCCELDIICRDFIDLC